MNYKKLNLTGSSAPHIRTKTSTRSIMGAVIIALLPALGFGVYNFGVRALANPLISIAGCCIFELLYRFARKKAMAIGDLSAAVTGMLIALASPVTAPYWLLLIGDFFAIVVVKQLFGGIGKNFVNPALAARAVMLLWTGEMTAWVNPRTTAVLWGAVDAVTSPTPLAFLRQKDLSGLTELYSLPEMFVGLTGGAVGEASALLLLAGGIFLMSRKIISWRIPAGFLGTAAVLFFLFPRGNTPLEWMLCHLLSGGLMLGAFFMATDYTTTPITPAGQLLFGIGCGFFTVIFRYFGFCNEGVGFAILLMNLTARPLDQYLRPIPWKLMKQELQERMKKKA